MLGGGGTVAKVWGYGVFGGASCGCLERVFVSLAFFLGDLSGGLWRYRSGGRAGIVLLLAYYRVM